MRNNRSMPRGQVIPELAYPDVAEAVAWLCEAFGFTERWTAGAHRAQLGIGDSAVVLMAGDDSQSGGDQSGGDRSLLNEPAANHAVMVRVEDVDAHHAHAQRTGAKILDEPTDFPYGERQYGAEDLAGHRWTFSQTIADVAPEEWGGQSPRAPGPREAS
jgi:uncharacterized glyoxalase superfamily protein PhnB